MTPCPNKDQCCCNCQYHIEDFYHCTTAAGTEAETEKALSGRCVCHQPRGWICIGMMVSEEGGRAYSGWSEHGMCELHARKK